MKTLSGIILIISIFSSLSCNPDSQLGLLFSQPDCQVTSIQKYDAAPGQFAKFVITVKNTNDATAINVGCSVNLKIGNTIIDRGYAYFGTLNSGESAIAEAWFTQINTQSDYQSYDMVLYWYDAENNYYQK